jgi:hypothetical protein
MVLVAGLAGLFVAAAPGAAEATPQAAATALVDCTANFPWVPALTWTPGGTCNGSITLVGAGEDDQGSDFDIQGTYNTFSATFTNLEPCFVNGQPDTFLSFAVGTFTVTGVAVTRPIAGGQTTAAVNGNFHWYRIGLNPVVTLTNVVLSFADGHTATALTLSGGGTATFVLPGTFNANTQLQCGQTGGPLTIEVLLAATLAA